jgi:hypothetical protein
MEEHVLRFLEVTDFEPTPTAVQSRFGDPELVATWGYNLLYSLEAHKSDAHVELFYEVCTRY